MGENLKDLGIVDRRRNKSFSHKPLYNSNKFDNHMQHFLRQKWRHNPHYYDFYMNLGNKTLPFEEEKRRLEEYIIEQRKILARATARANIRKNFENQHYNNIQRKILNSKLIEGRNM